MGDGMSSLGLTMARPADVHVMNLEQGLGTSSGRVARVSYEVPQEYVSDQLSWNEYYGPTSRFRAFLLPETLRLSENLPLEKPMEPIPES